MPLLGYLVDPVATGYMIDNDLVSLTSAHGLPLLLGVASMMATRSLILYNIDTHEEIDEYPM